MDCDSLRCSAPRLIASRSVPRSQYWGGGEGRRFARGVGLQEAATRGNHLSIQEGEGPPVFPGRVLMRPMR